MTDRNSPLLIKLTPQAEHDLENIWTYTATTWSVAQAESYIGHLSNTFDLIAHAPLIARERSEFTPPIRLHRHQSHLIIYRLVDDSLLIIRVLHMKQNWSALLED
ncbi:MAG: type II toxin-antitoxin system RelE/ParE family toxin [Aquidulcibacter sp.]|jgi:toxin ParE1/3/4|uniref:type II toxin-antitoxin system RelE/ParE family toxin n=1 Tax=Aquidulcibacter sp. TaxID=2052990 RepID=UPI0022C792E3|nr:type II toxin-antitoxin system RelE/ParE family toxin [Aquidulcibacter sp.]MCZ8207155.1 type II toxin-antitoxin system RelE/ParE family toxin [Aquidulcibacter sp.]